MLLGGFRPLMFVLYPYDWVGAMLRLEIGYWVVIKGTFYRSVSTSIGSHVAYDEHSSTVLCCFPFLSLSTKSCEGIETTKCAASSSKLAPFVSVLGLQNIFQLNCCRPWRLLQQTMNNGDLITTFCQLGMIVFHMFSKTTFFSPYRFTRCSSSIFILSIATCSMTRSGWCSLYCLSF